MGPFDEILDDKKPSLNTEDLLLQAIMAKMKITDVHVEELRRPRDQILRPNGPILGGAIPKVPFQLLSDRIPQFAKEEEAFSLKIRNDVGGLFMENVIGRGDEDIEIEAAFGRFEGNVFRPGLTHAEFISVNYELNQSTKLSPSYSHDIVEIMSDGANGSIRRKYLSGNEKSATYELKQRDSKRFIPIPQLGVRISRSTELAIVQPKKWSPEIRRQRYRTSFSNKDIVGREFLEIDEDLFYGFTIDTTIVIEENLPEKQSQVKYEVEIECQTLGKNNRPGLEEKFIDIIKYVYSSSISNGTGFALGTKALYFTVPERLYVAKLHNTLFEKDIDAMGGRWIAKDERHLYSNTYWNKPRNIKISDLVPTERFHLSKAAVTVKLDGKRYFLLCARKACYLIMPPYTVIRFGELLDYAFDGSLLDGELVNKKGLYNYYVFDLLFYKSNDVRQENFVERLSMLQKIVKAIKPFYGKIEDKVYYTKGTLYDRLEQANENYQQLKSLDSESVDGIIIQPSHYYNNKDTLKWKPPEQLTLDFKLFPVTSLDSAQAVRITKKNMDRAFLLGVKNGTKIELFQPIHPIKYDGDMILYKEELEVNREPLSNSIVECRWDFGRQMFLPVRVRADRNHPNNIETAYDVWRDIHNPMLIETLLGKNLLVMRKLHNSIKEKTLSKYLTKGDTIIDIGSGRGGDLNKWRKLGLEQVFAIEPNHDNAVELNRRLNIEVSRHGKKFPVVNLLEFGAQETDKIKRWIKDVDIKAIVTFFSLSFFGETKKIWDQLFQTLDLIPIGGYLIGGMMDGKRVFNLLEKERKWRTQTIEQLETQAEELNRDANRLLQRDPYAVEEADEMYKEAKRLEAEAKNRKETDFKPIEANDQVVYESDAFSIKQISDFEISEPDRNEIEITIHDETSMVKNQVEWLINYDLFKKRLIGMGFIEQEDSFINGPDAQYLPAESRIFSSLIRVFCFYRPPEKIEYIVPSFPGELQYFKNDYDRNMVLLGVHEKYGSFIHAILQIVSEKYRLSTDKDEFVLKLRKAIAKSLTFVDFQTLHDGAMAKGMAFRLKSGKTTIKNNEEAMAEAFNKFKKRLIDPSIYLSGNSLLELLAERYKVAIYLITISTGGIVVSKYSSRKIQCDEILNHKKAIIIGTENNLTFFPVGRRLPDEEPSYLFSSKDPIIKKMHDKVC